MEKKDFKERLQKATKDTVEFTRDFVREPLPDSTLYRISLNSSYDGNPLDEDEAVFPGDSQFSRSASFVGCTRAELVDVLWRDGRIPQWIDLHVIAEDDDNTIVQAVSCGRYTANEKLLYHQQEGYPPFHVCSPPLPVGYEKGDRFSVYHNAECWSWDDVCRLPREGDAPWSLKLFGPNFGDDALPDLPPFPSLEILELQHVSILGRGLANLGRQPRLRVLRLRLAEVETFSLQALSTLEGLTNLELINLPATTAGFDELAERCPQLTSLTIESAAWAPRLWPGFTRLRSLSLTLAHPAQEPGRKTLATLDKLSMHGDGVTSDYAAVMLKNAPRLTAAHFYNSGVDDKVLSAVEQHPRLEYLNVVDTAVTAKGIANLVARRPKLRVQPRPASE